MGSNASLIDYIAHGGPGGAQTSATEAQTALAQAQVPQVQAQTANTAAQLPTIQEQGKQAQLGTQIEQKKLDDERIMSDILRNSDPATLRDPQKLLGLAAKGGMTASGAVGLANTTLGLQTGISKLSADQLKLEDENLQQIQGGLQGYESAKTPEAYASFYGQLAKAEPQMVQQLGLPAPGQGLPTDQQIAALEGRTKLFDAHLKQGLEKAQADAAAANTKKTNAELPGVTADSDRKKLGLDLMQKALAHPEQGEALIDQALPASLDPQANSFYKGSYKAQLGDGSADALQHAAEVVKTAANHAAALSKAVQQNKADTAKAEALAVSPVHTQEAVNTQSAIAARAPGAYAGIPTVAEQRDAMNETDKVAKDYTTKADQVAQMRDILAEVKGGNKAAAPLAAITELRALLPRITKAELASVSSGAGNDLDKIQGWITGHVEGQPIPADVLAGMERIADVQNNAADRVWDEGTQRLKQRGVKIDQIEKPKVAGVAPASDWKAKAQSAKAGDIIQLPNGHKVKANGDGTFMAQ